MRPVRLPPQTQKLYIPKLRCKIRGNRFATWDEEAIANKGNQMKDFAIVGLLNSNCSTEDTVVKWTYKGLAGCTTLTNPPTSVIVGNDFRLTYDTERQIYREVCRWLCESDSSTTNEPPHIWACGDLAKLHELEGSRCIQITARQLRAVLQTIKETAESAIIAALK